MPECAKPIVWPILHYRDTGAARRFMVDVLGFEESVAARNEQGDIVHAEMRWPTGGGLVFGSAGHTDSVHGQVNAGTNALYIVTDDVDGVYQRARNAGAEIAEAPASVTFGSGDEAYACTLRDFEGNLWTFGTYQGADHVASETTKRQKPLVVVMGVSASGKSTVGKLLAERLGIVYADGDDFHSTANIARMQGGTPLDDADRRPWLDAIGEWLHKQADAGGVISCSALKRAYRDRLRHAAPNVLFLHLCGGEKALRRRVAARKDHFMPASLLDSQLDTLEPLEKDEAGIAVELTQKPASIVAAFLNDLDKAPLPTTND